MTFKIETWKNLISLIRIFAVLKTAVSFSALLDRAGWPGFDTGIPNLVVLGEKKKKKVVVGSAGAYYVRGILIHKRSKPDCCILFLFPFFLPFNPTFCPHGCV